MSALLILSALVCVSSVHAAIANFNTYLQGNWTMSLVTPGKASFELEPLQIDATFVKDNDSLLIGSLNYTKRESKELSHQETLHFNFDTDSENKGTAFLVKDDEVKPRFPFDFTTSPNDYHYSTGEWNPTTDSDASYSMILTDQDRFVLTVVQPTQPTVVYLGKRILEVKEKTFWEKYSTWILMIGMVIVNSYIQRKTRNAGLEAGAEGEAVASNAAPAAAAAVAAPTPEAVADKKKK